MNLRPTSRCGFTLVELLAVATLTSLLMAIAVGLLHQLLQYNRRVDHSATRAAACHRLEQQLRKQLRIASDVRADGPTLTVANDQTTSTYHLNDAGCLLSIDSSDGPRHERYTIGPSAAWNVRQQQSLVTVTVEPAGEAQAPPLRVVVARPQPPRETGQ